MRKNIFKKLLIIITFIALMLCSFITISNADTTETNNVDFSKLKGTYYFYPESYFSVQSGNVLKRKSVLTGKTKLTGLKTIQFYTGTTYKLTTTKSTYNLQKVKIDEKVGYINAKLIQFKESVNITTNKYKEGVIDGSKLKAKHYFYPLDKTIVYGTNITFFKAKSSLEDNTKIKVYTDVAYTYTTSAGSKARLYLAEIDGKQGFINVAVAGKLKNVTENTDNTNTDNTNTKNTNTDNTNTDSTNTKNTNTNNKYKEGTLDASKLKSKHYFYPKESTTVSGTSITKVKAKTLLSGSVKIKIYTDKTYDYTTGSGSKAKMYLAEMNGKQGFVNASLLAKVK